MIFGIAPNITGFIPSPSDSIGGVECYSTNVPPTGALSFDGIASITAHRNWHSVSIDERLTYTSYFGVYFRAHYSNSIYSASSTVQANACAAYVIVKI